MTDLVKIVEGYAASSQYKVKIEDSEPGAIFFVLSDIPEAHDDEYYAIVGCDEKYVLISVDVLTGVFHGEEDIPREILMLALLRNADTVGAWYFDECDGYLTLGHKMVFPIEELSAERFATTLHSLLETCVEFDKLVMLGMQTHLNIRTNSGPPGRIN